MPSPCNDNIPLHQPPQEAKQKTIVDIGNTNIKYCLWSDEKGALASGQCPTSSALFQVIEIELARLHPKDCPPFVGPAPRS
ncbi:MAG: hypothetical protein IPM93_19945 [Candidatus Obscuribacter sp.]|nr:hypothetical protein [Candidatus Obscuribacter sp.]